MVLWWLGGVVTTVVVWWMWRTCDHQAVGPPHGAVDEVGEVGRVVDGGEDTRVQLVVGVKV